MNLLQYLWRDTNGYLIHPIVGARDKSLKVADVATATGYPAAFPQHRTRILHFSRLWLCELDNEHFGSHQLYGFDISPSSFIAADHLPKTVQLKVLDASKPPPDEWKSQFDVVHIRLLQSVIIDDDPSGFIAHCTELLRPGGYLQWEEFDPMAMTLYKHDGKAENLQKLSDMLKNRAPAKSVVLD